MVGKKSRLLEGVGCLGEREGLQKVEGGIPQSDGLGGKQDRKRKGEVEEEKLRDYIVKGGRGVWGILCSCWQCCGSGMIYSGSGSSFEFLEFRIRINPILFKDILDCLKTHHIQLKTESFKFQLSAIFYFILPVQSFSTGLYLGLSFLFICSFIFCWIRIRNNNSGSRTLWSLAYPVFCKCKVTAKKS